MIRMTKQTDYALVLLAAFCNAGAVSHSSDEGRNSVDVDRFSARELAVQTSLPEPMVSKILKILLKHQILDSKRGSSGGYALAMDPEKLSVGHVVEAMEGPLKIVECACADGDCGYSPLCPIRENIKMLNEAIRKSFESISVLSMTKQNPPSFVDDFAENITSKLKLV